MVEIMLGVATFIGGLSAIWFFGDIYKKNFNPIVINFNVEKLDGYSFIKKESDNRIIYIKGIKFNATVENISNRSFFLKEINLTKKIIDEKVIIPKKTVTDMIFGSPIVPHQLFLILKKKITKRLVEYKFINGI